MLECKTKQQETNEVHSLYGQNPAERRLKSRSCFLRSVKPADFPPKGYILEFLFLFQYSAGPF